VIQRKRCRDEEKRTEQGTVERSQRSRDKGDWIKRMVFKLRCEEKGRRREKGKRREEEK